MIYDVAKVYGDFICTKSCNFMSVYMDRFWKVMHLFVDQSLLFVYGCFYCPIPYALPRNGPNEYKNGWTNEWMNKWTNGRTNKRANEYMNKLSLKYITSRKYIDI